MNEAVLATVGHKAAQVGAGTTVLGWLLSSQGTAVLGISIGVCGLLIQWYYRRKQDKREQAEHERRMGLYE
jgi:hypothetical protein